MNHSTGLRYFSVALLVAGLSGQWTLADSISFSPSEGNALTPFTIKVEGFIGSNGPVAVDVNGAGIVGGCSSSRPCTFQANMGYFSGKYWVQAAALVDGVAVVVSNSFTVHNARAYISRACGTNGTKLIATGYAFHRNAQVYVDNVPFQADEDGNFSGNYTIYNGTIGPINIVTSDGFRHVTNQFIVGPDGSCEEEIGHARDVEGGATIRRPGGSPIPLKPGDPIHLGDEIRTLSDGRARFDLADQSTFTLGPNARLTPNNYFYDPANNQNDSAAYGFLEGAFRYVSGMIARRPNPDINMQTSYGNLGIRGTEFISRRDPCSTTQEVYLIHGQLAIKPLYASMTNIVDAPVTIFYDATNVTTSGLTQAAYDALVNEINQTNLATFPSWQVQYFGCTNNPSAVANSDPDSDGQNNYAEFLAHTDPTTNTSVFRLISGTRDGNGVRLVWQTHGGITNVVQAAGTLDSGYSDISPDISIPGDEDTTTNYLDLGAVTNGPSRFYRIRLKQ